MSRGRGGHHGAMGSTKLRIGSFETNWDIDPDMKVDAKPEQLFPTYDPKPPASVRRYERAAVARYRTLRNRIHEGPLYTILGDNVRITKTGSRAIAAATGGGARGAVKANTLRAGTSQARSRLAASAAFDPFETMPTYTQKYKKQRHRIPRLDTRPYVAEFFPKELWDTLGVVAGEESAAAGTTTATAAGGPAGKGKKKRKLQIARSNKLSRLEQLELNGEFDIDEDEDEDDKDEDDEDVDKEPEDDDFGEDEDNPEDDDDYNGEKYFDNGEEDYDDYGGGGGGEDYGDFD